MTSPGIDFLSVLTLYAEICDIKRFCSAEKLAHYAGLVSKVRQSSEKMHIGRETKQCDKWLKWILIEASWLHVRFCLGSRLAGVYEEACRRKKVKRN